MIDIVRLQKFGGNWEFTAEFCTVIGKDMKSVEHASPVKVRCDSPSLLTVNFKSQNKDRLTNSD